MSKVTLKKKNLNFNNGPLQQRIFKKYLIADFLHQLLEEVK